MVDKDGILLLGGDGMLGRTLRKNWPGRSLVYTTRRQKTDSLALYCDFESSNFENDLPHAGVFILAAGITTFQGCERAPEKAWVVNVEAVAKIAKYCSRHGIRLIFLSSSSIFNGMSQNPEETAPPNPTTLYGKMKKEAENLVQGSRCCFQIVRLTKIMDSSSGFIRECSERLDHGEKIVASPQMPVAPLRGKWVQVAIQKCLNIKEDCILHLSPRDETNYYKLAEKIVAEKNLPLSSLLVQSESELKKNSLWTPRHAKLSTERSSRILNLEMPSWTEVLKEVK
jgi:dTDP-4-dehydrorhamnose reductase